MIFAYRSVELVIAFMGTLAAVVTITVLDPAYPPARQKIYLQDSQTKALISIGRAKGGPKAPGLDPSSSIISASGQCKRKSEVISNLSYQPTASQGTASSQKACLQTRTAKVDGPILPFPDAALISEEASEEDLKSWEGLISTNKDLAEQWVTLVCGLNANTLRLESDFFYSGGHGLLAQQLLLNIRQKMGTNVSIHSLYSNSSLKALSVQVDRPREGNDDTGAAEEGEPAFTQSLEKLLGSLDAKYRTADPATLTPERKTTVFMTGARGFLGCYIVKDLLERKNVEVLAHVRGTRDVQAALGRLKRPLSYRVWQDSWAVRPSAVIGDLS
ncbi:L-2-aminoadipate reductase [Metarhizium brunneum]|uniref:L-2-aminoadipate reductase n=1 Tax=Metarhizium brunneum TaxID=500148 RepID=A0A7D5URW6_9HYPO|nr:L-2-aminoadipate reductase [Metarhizium brunneum]